MQAQSIHRSVIGSAGQTFNNGGITLRSTTGEAITPSISNGSLKITQGFQQNLVLNTPLPITGLDFLAQRINSQQVKLKWRSITETNNKGFGIERKKENEDNYSDLDFVNSKAVQGNSIIPLEYEYTDDNAYNGYTYYRLKQQDMDGKFIYSIVRIVKGELNNNVTMKVWPIPANSYINIMIDGIQKPESIDLLDLNGKIFKSYSVYNQQQQRIELSGLASGIYFLKLKSDESLIQKIIIQ